MLAYEFVPNGTLRDHLSGKFLTASLFNFRLYGMKFPEENKISSTSGMHGSIEEHVMPKYHLKAKTLA